MVDVTFIIVNFNTKQLLNSLLSFFESSHFPFSYSIIVVDNNSIDGSRSFLNEKRGIIVVLNDENIGYGRAVNKGLIFADSKYVCILNTDVVLDNDALSGLWRFMEKNSNVGVCSPIVYWPNGRIQGFFFKFNMLFFYSDFLNKIYSKIKKFYLSKAKSAVKVDGVIGAFIFLRRSLIKDNKLFDEDYFFYYEDTDLAHRLKKDNILTMVLPQYKIIHQDGQSSKDKNWRLFYTGRYIYIKKHYGIEHARRV